MGSDPLDLTSRSVDDLHADTDLELLVNRLVDELVERWTQGDRPLVEEYLEQYPELREEDAIRLIYEESCLRQEAGEPWSSKAILKRFPQWRAKLSLLFDAARLMRVAPTIEFPEVGDDISDFKLLLELGRGALGRTYLASQYSLVDRPVVLKVMPLEEDEHLSLARLQHMHIVPLYFERALPDLSIRLLGMPYLGGTSFDQILEGLRATRVVDRTGSHIIALLDRFSRPIVAECPANGPFRKYFDRARYEEAIAWIGVGLGDALQYAHDRGLVHLDVKPSNVLLAGDGQPMLLDFHLARGPVGPGLPVPEKLGGTPGYMSPEQEAAMAAIRDLRPITHSVDGRSDLYSLGLLLYEALCDDPCATAGSERIPLHQCNPHVSSGLSDIISKCLCEDPNLRYPNAAALALDLRHHLYDEPLRGVANRSVRERWNKWRKRRPEGLSRVIMQVALVAFMIAAGAFVILRSRSNDQMIQLALNEGRQDLTKGRFEAATATLSHALALANTLNSNDPRRLEIESLLRRIRRDQTLTALHELVNLFRFSFGITPPSREQTESLFQGGLAIWAKRSLLSRPGLGKLDGVAERQAQTDFLDLATILADLGVNGHPESASPRAVEDALQILNEAVNQFGGSPALDRDIRRYKKVLGQGGEAVNDLPPAQSAWEHYDLGRSHLRSESYEQAEREFRESIRRQPGEFWPYFYQATCAYRLSLFREAVDSFNVCVALAPRSPECYYNRALAHEAIHEDDLALEDYSHALTLNPDFFDALLNRGILRYKTNIHDEAIADFNRAKSLAPSAKSRGQVLYNLALVFHARSDASATKTNLESAIQYGDLDAKELYERLNLNSKK